jgi:uncharacterized protein with von Willebrand factor type A (vWA) domain
MSNIRKQLDDFRSIVKEKNYVDPDNPRYLKEVIESLAKNYELIKKWGGSEMAQKSNELMLELVATHKKYARMDDELRDD